MGESLPKPKEAIPTGHKNAWTKRVIFSRTPFGMYYHSEINNIFFTTSYFYLPLYDKKI